MSSIVVRVTGLKEAIAGQERVRRAVRDDIRRTVEQSVAKIQRESALELYPGHGLRTGNLRRSILFDLEELGDTLLGRVGPVTQLAPYGIYVEEGRGSFRGYRYMRAGVEKSRRFVEQLIAQMTRFWTEKF